MRLLVSSVRSLRATPLGRYIPGNKVLAGLLAGSASAALAKAGVVDVPPLYVSLAAFAAVSYLLPESPVAAAHVLTRRKPVTIKQRITATVPITVGPSDLTLASSLARGTVKAVGLPEQPGPLDASGQPPVVPPQSA